MILGKTETVGNPSSIQAARSRKTSVLTRFPILCTTLEAITLFGFTAFFLFYGLVPVFGGAGLGLVGADEPRYAQIAREMLVRRDFITPILYGHPWLEKPALYYWRAMFAFREFGVHDWSARLPSASFAFVLVTLIYLHIRRFRPGGQLDAALITASCAGIMSFARGASTDMQLAAPFCIGMLGWYAWYETDKKFWLFDLYFFVGAATLAKGPVAPFMALVILVTFAALRREWSILRRSIWVPGIILYLAMVLPWFIAVQHRNPQFFSIFFLEHNLERFATDKFRHGQPVWFYIPITLVALLPWAVLAVTALADAIRDSVAEWRARRAKHHYVGNPRAGDAFPEFLVLWALFPIVFFSLSRSKLPGYIIPAIPPLTILTGDYLNRIRHRGLKPWLLIAHATLTGLMVTLVLLLPRHIQQGEGWPPVNAVLAACAVGVAAAVLIMVVVARFGVHRLRIATMASVVVLLLFIFGVGPFFGVGTIPATKRTVYLLDTAYSARPLARILRETIPPGEIIAVYRVRRDMKYGLSFYQNREVTDYEVINSDESLQLNPDGTPRLQIPPEQHILVVRENYVPDLSHLLEGRTYEPLFTYPAQNLVIYTVAARH